MKMKKNKASSNNVIPAKTGIQRVLNERQIKAVMYVKEKGKMTNKGYQEVCNISERTATRDLSNLVSLGLFMQMGVTGKRTEYILTRHKDATKTPSGQSIRLPWWESLPALPTGRQGKV